MAKLVVGLLLLAVLVAYAVAVPAAVRPDDTGKEARQDANSYFAKQQTMNEVHELEDFESSHSDEMARDALPCETDEKLKLQCASLSRASRMHRKFKVADEQHSNKLFDEPYRASDSRHFAVSQSTTFVPQSTQTFDLNYADGTHLRGFSGVDQIYMGNYKATSPFGVITDCNSPDFNGVDGILGFGLPKDGSNLPTPVLFAMTDAENKDTNAAELKRKFSFFSTDTAAEVQLGGYDPATVADTMWYTPALSAQDFIVGASSLKFGHSLADSVELLQFNSDTQKQYGAPSIMDSGTSCLVIPADNMDGQLANVPWDDFANKWEKGKNFYLTIGQKTWQIPFSSWYLAETDQTCVQPSPEGMSGLLVGDVFFREYVVEFDMTQGNPIIGIAPLNKQYNLVQVPELASFELNVAPRQKLKLVKGNEIMYPAEHSEVLTQVDRIPIVNKKGTQYFMDVGIGSPKQKFTVIFDTGSAVFGVFSYKKDLPANIKNQLPSYYFSENLHSLEQVSVSTKAAPLSMDMLSSSPNAIGALLALNCVFIGAIVVVIRRRAAREAAGSADMATLKGNNYGTL
jgi:hypothetical protein